MDLAGWFTSNNLSENLRTVVPRVVLVQEPEQSSSDSTVLFLSFEHVLFMDKDILCAHYFISGEFEWDIQRDGTEVAMLNDSADESSSGILALPSSTDNAEMSDDTNMNVASLPALPSISGAYSVRFCYNCTRDSSNKSVFSLVLDNL